MSDDRARVLVVGGGPAALAAAARLLERGGRERVRVRLATMGHHFGGKADSWRDAEGRLIDHGQHVIVGWYHEMKALLRRAGVDVDAHLVQNQGHTFIYEPRDGRVHDLALTRNPITMLVRGLGYSGLTGEEKANIAWFVISNLRAFLGLQDLEQFDDLCMTSWCLSNGLMPSIVKTNAFRMSRTGQLNWPGEISAYSLLQAATTVAADYRSASYAFCDGGMSERFWEPLVRYISELGGEVQPMRKLTGFQIENGRLTGARFAAPDSAGHDLPSHPRGRSRFEHVVPIKPGSEEVDRDFDQLICTVPATAFQELNPGDADFWRLPEMAKIRELSGIAPLALQIWHQAPLSRRYSSVIAGLDGPLGFVLDNKPIIREYRQDPRYGSVLYFVGQETGCEDWSDDALLAQCLDNVARLPGFEAIDRAGIIHSQVIRNRSVDKLYFNTEPGIQRFRPHKETSIAGLWLAGDWVRSELDFPCMEAAIRSGIAAADAVLARGGEDQKNPRSRAGERL
ncbi:MAG: FAD-dependent oxidoreductase [Deltaproteobacteria bacterium]|nr:FAD-dependent oxidoreductase [Deltaproteobacteria bacterium]